jgi:hypothetical protein
VCFLVLFEHDSICEKDIIQIRINHYKKKESYSIQYYYTLNKKEKKRKRHSSKNIPYT